MRFILLIFLFSLTFSPLFAQRHHFVSYSIKDGLAQSQVRDMVQTSDGFIWIATIGGVSRFDGFRFENFNKSNGLLSNYVSCLHEHDSTLWAACDGGLVALKGAPGKIIPFDNSLQSVTIVDMASVPESPDIYLITNDSRLLVFDGTSITKVETIPGEQNVMRALEFYDDRMLIGTKEGLFEWKNEELIPVKQDVSVSSIHVSGQTVWMTSLNGGVLYSTSGLQNWSVINRASGLRSNHTRDLAFDSKGNCLIMGKYQLFILDPESEELTAVVPLDEELRANPRTVICDNEDNFWIGTGGSGVVKYTGADFEVFTSDDELLPSNIVMDIAQRADGSLWFATYGRGVVHFDGDSSINYAYADSLLNNTVWCLMDSPEGMWIGTSEGINIWNEEDEQISSFEFNDELPFQRVSKLFRDGKGQTWIGTRDGVSVYNGETIITPEPFKNSRIDIVRGFTEHASVLYIASGRGLFAYHLDSGELQSYTESEGMPDPAVNCLSKDVRGNIWMGTGNGVAVLDPKSQGIRSLRISDNFSSNIVNFIHADSRERLWAGTDNGLFKLDLKAYYDGQEVRWKSFGEHDGVTSSEYNQNAVFEDSDGHLWFGTDNGLFKYSATNGLENSDPLREPYIQLLQQNYETVDQDARRNESGILEFSSRENRLTFYYSTVHFSNPNDVWYSYRLLGSTDEWSPSVKEDHVTFSNMSPGSYTFQVRAKKSAGEWSNSFASVEVFIMPPFWLTWWFISIVVLIILSLAYQVHVFREKQRQRKKVIDDLRNKARILGLEQQTLNAHMNRHFIFNALNSIQYYINTQDRKSANMYLTNFAHLVRKNLDSAQVDMIYLKDELERLKLYLKLEQMRFTDRFDFELEVDSNIDQETVKVPSMILQPFVENSIMHGILPLERKGVIHVGIKRNDDGMEFVIRDNGIGIMESLKQKKSTSQHVSNGMRITRQRMDLLKKMSGKNFSVIGPFELKDSAENEIIGTEVRILLPEVPILLTPLVLN